MFLLEAHHLLVRELVGSVVELQCAVIQLLGEALEAIYLALHLLQVKSGVLRVRKKLVPTILSFSTFLLPCFQAFSSVLLGQVKKVLEDVTLCQQWVAGHVVHPPDQAFLALGDEVFFEGTSGLLLRQVGHRDDESSQPGATASEVLVVPVHWHLHVRGHQLVGNIALHTFET